MLSTNLFRIQVNCHQVLFQHQQENRNFKFVVALYTNKDCFPIAFESEDELLRWFITFLRLQLVDRVSEGEELKFTVRQSLVHTHASLLIQSSL